MLTEIKPHMPNTQGAVVAILQADKKSPAKQIILKIRGDSEGSRQVKCYKQSFTQMSKVPKSFHQCSKI